MGQGKKKRAVKRKERIKNKEIIRKKMGKKIFFGSLSNVGVPFKSSTTDGRECFFLTSFFIVVLHETAIESALGIC